MPTRRPRLSPPTPRAACAVLAAVLAVNLVLVAAGPEAVVPSAEARAALAVVPTPSRLSETGLYVDGSTTEVRPDNHPFAIQYPLWTDGATKQRWIHLPAGTFIDGTDPDSWIFPAGTRLWKEFSFEGQRVETRYMEALPDGRWRYATYLWLPDGSDAELAPTAGLPKGLPVAGPSSRHVIPGQADCAACHEGQPSRVLGFSLLQLSSDRDPNALHPPSVGEGDLDLDTLVARKLIRRLPAEARKTPPRIEASTELERAARGYLHGNCGGCHNARGPLANLGMVLAWSSDDPDAILRTTVRQDSRFKTDRAPDAVHRVEPGDSANSVLAVRLGAQDPWVRMPALGTVLVDEEGAALVRAWIDELDP